MKVFSKIKLFYINILAKLKSTQISGLLESSKFSKKIKDDKSNIFNWDICKDSAKIRILVVVCGFSICFLSLTYRLLIIANNEYSKSNSLQAKASGFRKEIVDRNGNLLAVNLPSCSLFANPQKVINPNEAVKKLAETISGINKNKLLAELKSDKSFVWIKRDITPKEQEKIFNLGLTGFDFEHEQKRMYAFGSLLSHVIGYVGRDFSGLAGLEKKFDKFLTNSDVSSNKIDTNKPLKLSIDVRLQSILSEEIDRTMSEFRAIGAVGIIANPKNGEILAMVSKPDFDPHQPHKASPAELFNKSSLGAFEIGSAFKTIPMTIGLDNNNITIQDAYDVTYMKVGKFSLKDYHPHKGWQTVPEIFLHSSNIGMGQIALEIGKDNLKRYFKNLGLLDRLQVELPECGSPLYPADSRWTDLSIVTMSYGYGLSITPLHFVQAVLPVVNGGNFYPLTLIKREENSKITPTKVFQAETSDEMKKLLRLVVKEGTGKRAEVKGYLVGGKTGTAEKLNGKKYAKNVRISSFLGVLPASDPQYVIYVMFDEPKGNKESFGFATAGFTAAPTVGRVFERMVALYGIEAIDENSTEAQNVINVDFKINNEV